MHKTSEMVFFLKDIYRKEKNWWKHFFACAHTHMCVFFIGQPLVVRTYPIWRLMCSGCIRCMSCWLHFLCGDHGLLSGHDHRSSLECCPAQIRTTLTDQIALSLRRFWLVSASGSVIICTWHMSFLTGQWCVMSCSTDRLTHQW